MISRYDKRHEHKKAQLTPATVQNDETKKQIDSLSETINSLQKRQKQIVTTRGKVQKEMRILKDQFYHNRSDENHTSWQDKKAAVRRENYTLLECRKTLCKAKNKRYLLQRQQIPTEGNKRDTVPAVAFPQCMDEAQRMDISQLQHAVTFSGTDYGLKTMSVTVPLNVSTISRHLRLYNRYACLESCADVETEDALSDSELLLPKPVKISAKHIKEVSFSRRHRRRREKLKKVLFFFSFLLH
ncbi:uncharacterized protein BYT42DRAFT_313978 [Radiomyces spectabilis]|uniref:uncharacterized protein n=1 Tax=Radiomyces spectabilis TaxID=64574 RepID=UPI002220E0F1|nr:uncharacterized protein BYT42DRAFT_313978 [Radiomyces spectabilis]KAI8379121.1 hypothetical protein BYT42DRAFT_313978 [Radiomyces spectabilis]